MAIDPNTLVVKTHGHMQNEREKKLAFEREDAMRARLESVKVQLQSAYDKIDAARTQVGVVRIAGTVGDTVKVAEALGQLDTLLFDAFCDMEKING